MLQGWTSLHLADNTDNLCVWQGQTLLHYTVIHNHLELVHLLINFGASMFIEDDEVCCINSLTSQWHSHEVCPSVQDLHATL